MKEENRQALFDLLDTDAKTNVGRIPAPDYLEMRAGEYGYDSYAEMYEEGYLRSWMLPRLRCASAQRGSNQNILRISCGIPLRHRNICLSAI